jgi:hypothetical protein
MKPMTTKQRHIMKIVVMGNLDVTGARESNVDVYQVMNRIPYDTTRESMMCSLGILEKQGWLVKAGKEIRDGRMKQTLEPTAAAIRVISPPKPVKAPEYEEIELDDDDIVLLELN